MIKFLDARKGQGVSVKMETFVTRDKLSVGGSSKRALNKVDAGEVVKLTSFSMKAVQPTKEDVKKLWARKGKTEGRAEFAGDSKWFIRHKDTGKVYLMLKVNDLQTGKGTKFVSSKGNELKGLVARSSHEVDVGMFLPLTASDVLEVTQQC